MRVQMKMIIPAVILAAAVAAAPGATYEIDSGHSTAQFSVRHLMVSNVRGNFGKVTGTVTYDGKEISSVSAEAVIDATTIDSRMTQRDEHLKSPDFFDVKTYPTITFKSKKAAPGGAGKFKLAGDLTIRGVTREVMLDVEGPTAEVKDPWGNTKMGATATTKVNRQDFGLKWNAALEAGGVVVGDEVSITIELELKRMPEAAATK